MYTSTKINYSVFLLLLLTFFSCRKTELPADTTESVSAKGQLNGSPGHLKQTKTFNSNVVQQWLNQQLAMFRLPLATGATAPSSDRAFAYSGIALYEAVVPGMPAYKSLGGQLTEFPQMPATVPGLAYHWAASANAALAAINRSLFANASLANKQAMDALELQLEQQYAQEVDAATLQRSIQFGKAVASAVWTWALTDGTSNMPSPASYQIPVGPGLWVQTSAALPANAFHQYRRQMVSNSRMNAAAPALPFAFSTSAQSQYYAMAKEVYDISQSLTTDQLNTALYHREGLGYGGGSSIAAQLSAVLHAADAKLDAAALAFAKVGIGTYEALTLTFIQKYQFNVMRPITYIRNHMGYASWNTVYNTPSYPEYPAGHPTNGGMLSIMLADQFGPALSFDVNYYSYLGLPARHYNSFEELAQEMAMARVYAGIHFKPAVHAGVAVGKKVAQNILAQLQFKKD